ncbi:MAG: hypothetical protein KC503_22675 [Myxococcales bacterium]|nr:hypothetical protein [Myxococcales bacterium]
MTESVDDIAIASPGRATARLRIDISRFRLPPVDSVLVIGRRAMIGPKAMAKAVEEMVPQAFELIAVDGDSPVEALLVRKVHLRRLPRERLVPIMLRHVEGLMDEQDMLHVRLEIEVSVTEQVEL